MKKFLFLTMLLATVFFIACGDDDTKNSNGCIEGAQECKGNNL